MLDNEKLSKLTPMQFGRVTAALDKLYRFSNGVRSLRAELERRAAAGPLEKAESDGMIDYSRTKFNRMGSYKEQAEYMARLKARRLYFVAGLQVPKIVYDAVKSNEREPVAA